MNTTTNAAPAASAASKRGRDTLVGAVAVLAVLAVASAWRSGPETHSAIESKGWCEQWIAARLKAPESARFSGVAATRVTGADGMGPFTASGWVEASNSFGGTVRQSYSCTMRFIDGKARLESLTLN